MTDCTYRYWPLSLSPFDGRTYANVLATGTNYDKSMRNDYDYYRGIVTADPPSSTPPYYTNYRFLRETHVIPGDHDRHLLVQYYQKVHETQADEAAIVLHGSSLYPDGWFADSPVSQSWPMPYTNYAGSNLFNAGFDVYAPKVQHHSAFANARRRVASSYGETWPELDVKRINALFNHLKALGYSKIHVAGLSYGAQLAVLFAQITEGDPARGMALAIEGWIHTRPYVENGHEFEEWASNFEMIFPGPTIQDVLSPPRDTWLAYGSCNAATYAATYAQIPDQSRVITYDGAHEFLLSVWQEAWGRYDP